MKKTVTMLIIMSIGLWAGFTKSGNIVTDSITGLQWQDDAVGSTMTWQGAITHCEGLSLGGYSNWRLANINELRSIVDRNKLNPTIVSGFDNVSSNYYWSSTTYKDSSNGAWIVNFYNGGVYGRNKYGNGYVRCVRAGE